MKPQQQYRADQLEELLSAHAERNVSAQMRPEVSDGVDPEVRAMAGLAHRLQAAPPLTPDPAFVQRLERKVLAHSVHRAQQTPTGRGQGQAPPLRSLPAYWFGNLVKGKVLAATLVCAVLLGGMGVAVAATVPTQSLGQNVPGVHATALATRQPGKTETNHGTATAGVNKQGQKGDVRACASLSEAQQLATRFSLSTNATGSTVQVICALHDGSFQTTVNGKSFTADHALGYGEINLLLMYAQVLAIKDGTKLTDGNVQKYVGSVLNTCGSTPVMACINSKIGGGGHDNTGKPTSVPTSNADGKPIVIPTPYVDWGPTSTVTP